MLFQEAFYQWSHLPSPLCVYLRTKVTFPITSGIPLAKAMSHEWRETKGRKLPVSLVRQDSPAETEDGFLILDQASP